MVLGAWVGDQIRVRNFKRRNIAQVNIRMCFPELDDQEAETLLKQHFRSYGQGLVDMGFKLMSTNRRVEKYSSIAGLENLTGHPTGARIIMITYHTPSVDFFTSVLSKQKMVVMMKRDNNPVLNWFLFHGRSRFQNTELFMRDQGLRGILSGMKKGKLCGLIPDEDLGDGPNTVFAPFFGQTRATLNIVSRLAQTTGAVVIPSIVHLDPNTGHYKTIINPPLQGFPGANHVEDSTRLNAAMEALIRQAPEQYLWTFRWFRTSVEGVDPYGLPASINVLSED
jgi:KDO2-lipid IV(A) lauroyltransferase